MKINKVYSIDDDTLRFIQHYEQNKGKKLYRELVSFLMNDTIPRMEVLGRFYEDDPHILVDGQKVQVNLATMDDGIGDVLHDLKDCIVKSLG